MENKPMKAGWVGIAASRVGQSDTDPLPKLLPPNIEPQHLKLLANLAIEDLLPRVKPPRRLTCHQLVTCKA